MNIHDIAATTGYRETQASQASLRTLAERFASTFERADQAAQGFATRNLDAQSVVEALSQAELALQTAVTVRDRVVAAYQDILRMPI